MKKEKSMIGQDHQVAKSDLGETYLEITAGRTTYRITSEFLGAVDLGQTLEHLAVSKVLAELESQTKAALLEK